MDATRIGLLLAYGNTQRLTTQIKLFLRLRSDSRGKRSAEITHTHVLHLEDKHVILIGEKRIGDRGSLRDH